MSLIGAKRINRNANAKNLRGKERRNDAISGKFREDNLGFMGIGRRLKIVGGNFGRILLEENLGLFPNAEKRPDGRMVNLLMYWAFYLNAPFSLCSCRKCKIKAF